MEQRLASEGRIPVTEAVELFRETVIGISHAHRRGVLHCDLKPANILLDQDQRPRLADFGQSRLSHEQRPSLGTLFYMAPEQADMEAIPDAGWDVYALGALLYCMLTGAPPYRETHALSHNDSQASLEEKLRQYRELILHAPRPTSHHEVPGVDRSLGEIIERCLDPIPEHRFRNAQSILDALDSRSLRKTRRPLVLLGLLGPLLMLSVMAFFAWRGSAQALRDTDEVIVARAKSSSAFAAKFAAEVVAHRLNQLRETVEAVANDPRYRDAVEEFTNLPDVRELIDQLNQPDLDPALRTALREQFESHPLRQTLQQRMRTQLEDMHLPPTASWFTTGRQGLHLAAAFHQPSVRSPIGRNFSWRTYFNGFDEDLPVSEGATDVDIIQGTHLSAVFRSTATTSWKMAVSTPIVQEDSAGQWKCLGIVALTVELGSFTGFFNEPHLFAVIVDGRPGDNRGQILQHPLYDQIRPEEEQGLSEDLNKFRVALDRLGETNNQLYHDPLGRDPRGARYRGDWVAAIAPVRLGGRNGDENPDGTTRDTGLVVLVQEDYEIATAPVHNLARDLLRLGGWALLATLGVLITLWYLVYRWWSGDQPQARPSPTGSVHNLETVELPAPLRS